MCTGRSSRNGNIETDGITSQNASDTALDDAAAIVAGGGCVSSSNSVARVRKIKFFPCDVSTPNTSIEIRPIESAGFDLCRFLVLPSVITIQTWPSTVPPPTKRGAGIYISNDTRGWDNSGTSRISVGLTERTKVLAGTRCMSEDTGFSLSISSRIGDVLLPLTGIV